MGILSNLLSRIPAPKGIRLDATSPFWEVSGKTDFSALLLALPDLLSQDSTLYFEGGSPSGELAQFLQERSIPERAHVAQGTFWPKPSVFHLPAMSETIIRLAELTRSRAYPELAIHFHAYHGHTVLLEWHDAFTQPMLLSGNLSEQKIRIFAERLGMSYKMGSVEQGAAPNAAPPHR